jgi:hypothetical protein
MIVGKEAPLQHLHLHGLFRGPGLSMGVVISQIVWSLRSGHACASETSVIVGLRGARSLPVSWHRSCTFDFMARLLCSIS